MQDGSEDHDATLSKSESERQKLRISSSLWNWYLKETQGQTRTSRGGAGIVGKEERRQEWEVRYTYRNVTMKPPI